MPPGADSRVERRELEELARGLVTVDARRAAAVAGGI
jgi:hypothetical protein